MESKFIRNMDFHLRKFLISSHSNIIYSLQVRGGFVTKPLQIASNSQESEPLQSEALSKTQINLSQLHQSRFGLLSQALMLIIISGFLFSETLSELWKTKV